MTLDTACRHHPFAVFDLYVQQNTSASVDPKVVEAMKKANCSLEVKPFEPQSFFEGSPFEAFARGNLSTLLAGTFNTTQVTNLLRATALWRNGGWYLDTDVVVLRPLTGLQNVVGLGRGRRPGERSGDAPAQAERLGGCLGAGGSRGPLGL